MSGDGHIVPYVGDVWCDDGGGDEIWFSDVEADGELCWLISCVVMSFDLDGPITDFCDVGDGHVPMEIILG